MAVRDRVASKHDSDQVHALHRLGTTGGTSLHLLAGTAPAAACWKTGERASPTAKKRGTAHQGRCSGDRPHTCAGDPSRRRPCDGINEGTGIETQKGGRSDRPPAPGFRAATLCRPAATAPQ